MHLVLGYMQCTQS